MHDRRVIGMQEELFGQSIDKITANTMSKEAKDIFLIECCRIAKGDTSLKIGIMRLLNSVKIDLSYKQAFDNIILPP